MCTGCACAAGPRAEAGPCVDSARPPAAWPQARSGDGRGARAPTRRPAPRGCLGRAGPQGGRRGLPRRLPAAGRGAPWQGPCGGAGGRLCGRRAPLCPHAPPPTGDGVCAGPGGGARAPGGAVPAMQRLGPAQAGLPSPGRPEGPGGPAEPMSSPEAAAARWGLSLVCSGPPTPVLAPDQTPLGAPEVTWPETELAPWPKPTQPPPTSCCSPTQPPQLCQQRA